MSGDREVIVLQDPIAQLPARWGLGAPGVGITGLAAEGLPGPLDARAAHDALASASDKAPRPSLTLTPRRA